MALRDTLPRHASSTQPSALSVSLVRDAGIQEPMPPLLEQYIDHAPSTKDT